MKSFKRPPFLFFLLIHNQPISSPKFKPIFENLGSPNHSRTKPILQAGDPYWSLGGDGVIPMEYGKMTAIACAMLTRRKQTERKVSSFLWYYAAVLLCRHAGNAPSFWEVKHELGAAALQEYFEVVTNWQTADHLQYWNYELGSRGYIVVAHSPLGTDFRRCRHRRWRQWVIWPPKAVIEWLTGQRQWATPRPRKRKVMAFCLREKVPGNRNFLTTVRSHWRRQLRPKGPWKAIIPIASQYFLLSTITDPMDLSDHLEDIWVKDIDVLYDFHCH